MNNGFDLLFNNVIIYDTLFWGVKTVTEHPNLTNFKLENEEKYNLWSEFVVKNFGVENLTDENYLKFAPLYPEFSKIIAIGYATIENKDNKINRNLKIISEKTEIEILKKFNDVLEYYDNIGKSTNPRFEFVMCGYNLINYDIPVYLKKYAKYFSDDQDTRLSYMMKSYLSSKPWNSNIIDINSVYTMNSSLPFVGFKAMVETFNLKQADNVLSFEETSKYYWENIEQDEKNTMKKINLQLGNQINTNIQFVNKFRTI
jgi:hypothetical protein